MKAVLKRRALELVLARARARKLGVVVTVHNLEAHEGSSPKERAAIERVFRRADAMVVLNTTEEIVWAQHLRPEHIPHGDYTPLYQQRRPEQLHHGRVLFFGLIRPYKNVVALVEAFCAVQDADLTLVIAGNPLDSELREQITSSIRRDSRIRTRLEALEEQDLVEEIAAAELVVLPYKRLYNSGAVFLAMTVGVPLLVPETEATRALQDEFGLWVQTYSGALAPEHIANALQSVRAAIRPGERPDLTQRDWSRIASKYAEIYRRVARD